MRLAGWWWGCLPWERQESAFPAESTSRSRSMYVHIHTLTWLICRACMSETFLGHFFLIPVPVYSWRIIVIIQVFFVCKKLPREFAQRCCCHFTSSDSCTFFHTHVHIRTPNYRQMQLLVRKAGRWIRSYSRIIVRVSATLPVASLTWRWTAG